VHGRRTGARLPGDIWTFGFFARSEKDNKVHRKRETRQVGIFRCLHVLDVTGIFGALLAIFRWPLCALAHVFSAALTRWSRQVGTYGSSSPA